MTQGGYSQAVVVNENFVLRIPDSLPLDKAAPLLCAGITLFTALQRWKAGRRPAAGDHRPGHGLGHMGRRLGAAMGAEVTVLSQSLKKMEKTDCAWATATTTPPPTATPSSKIAQPASISS